MDCVGVDAAESVTASRKNYDVGVRCVSGVRDRYYEPETGRYVTSDPIGLGGGLNTFGYVGGNPLKYTDSTGLFFPVVICASGACQGGLAVLGAGVAAITAGTIINDDSGSDFFDNTGPLEDVCEKAVCDPCTPYPVGTLGYQGPEIHQRGIDAGEEHYHVFIVRQNPSTCECFWNNAPKKQYGHSYRGPIGPGWINLNGSPKRPPNYPH